MTQPVSFELAKLLKEKGFKTRVPNVWLFSLGKAHLRDVHLSLELNDAEYNAPTIAEVVMWLYEKHRIWVEANYLPNVEKFAFIAKPLDFKKPKEFASYKEYYEATKQFVSTEKYDSPTEAYEAAIEYTSKHLI